MKNLIGRRQEEFIELNKKFMKDTKSKEILIIILKGHLYIENEIIGMLTETIIDEKIINQSTFRQKLELAHSMGIIKNEYGVFGKVNTIRNKYAHNIDYEFTEKDYEDLISTMPKVHKDEFLKDLEECKNIFYDKSIPEFNFKIQLLLNNIWFLASTCRLKGKEAIELRLKEKEIETLNKYVK